MEDALRSRLSTRDAMDMARRAFEEGRQTEMNRRSECTGVGAICKVSNSAASQGPDPWESEPPSPSFLQTASQGTAPPVSGFGTASTDSGYRSEEPRSDDPRDYRQQWSSQPLPPPPYNPQSSRPAYESALQASRPPTRSSQSTGGGNGNARLEFGKGPDGLDRYHAIFDIDERMVNKRLECDFPTTDGAKRTIAITVLPSDVNEIFVRRQGLNGTSPSSQPGGFSQSHIQNGLPWHVQTPSGPHMWDPATQSWVPNGFSTSHVGEPLKWGEGPE